MSENDLKELIINTPDLRKNLDTFLSLLCTSVLAAASRSVLSEDKRTLTGFLRGLVLASFASYLIGSLLSDYHLHDGLYHCAVGLSGFLADDIFILILKSVKALRDDPRAIWQAVLDTIVEKLTFRKKGE